MENGAIKLRYFWNDFEEVPLTKKTQENYFKLGTTVVYELGLNPTVNIFLIIYLVLTK